VRIFYCENLKSLNLNRTELLEIDKYVEEVNLKDLVSLSTLIIPTNKNIKEFPESLVNLTELDCSNSNIKFIPESFVKLNTLKINITKIKAIPNFRNLKYLECNSSEIDRIENFQNLKTIHCMYSNVSRIFNIPNLEFLNCHSCKNLISIPNNNYKTIIKNDCYWLNVKKETLLYLFKKIRNRKMRMIYNRIYENYESTNILDRNIFRITNDFYC
jgi:hypothetical protein